MSRGATLDQSGHAVKRQDDTLDATYLDLVRAFPLVSIRDDAHLTEALATIDALLDVRPRSLGAEAYLSALTDLVETYENIHVPEPDVRGVALLRYLMEENSLSQQDLVPIFGTQSIVSEVLSGKRRLALSHIGRLASRFHLPADVFIEPAPQPVIDFRLSF